MKLARFPSILIAVLTHISCKIRIVFTKGWLFSTQLGNYIFAAGRACDIDLVDTFLDETFTSVPSAGFKF